jgi:hypothetical protein
VTFELSHKYLDRKVEEAVRVRKHIHTLGGACLLLSTRADVIYKIASVGAQMHMHGRGSE